MNLKEINKKIGQNIKSARYENGFTQTQIGDAIGVSFQQIQKYERGTDSISAAKLLAIAKFLSRPITFFYDLESDNIILDDITSIDPREIVRLSRAWLLLKDELPRKKLLELIQAMGGSSSVH